MQDIATVEQRGGQARPSAGRREIAEGTYAGHLIRRARKDYTCDGARGLGETYRKCRQPIAAGSFYVEGDVDIDRAGGFGHDRLCPECVDDAARAALAKARGQ